MKPKLKTKKARPKLGGNFEKKIAKKLSLVWTDNERDDIFYRTGGSGSRFTSRMKYNKNTEGQSGDITFTDPIGKPLIDLFNIECKKGYGIQKKKKKLQDDGSKKEVVTKTNWDILDFIDSKQETPKLLEFWTQCYDDSLKANKKPMLIFQRNNKLSGICLDTKDLEKLWKYHYENSNKSIYLSDYIYLIQLDTKQLHLTLMNFDQFITVFNLLRAYCQEECCDTKKESKTVKSRKTKTLRKDKL